MSTLLGAPCLVDGYELALLTCFLDQSDQPRTIRRIQSLYVHAEYLYLRLLLVQFLELFVFIRVFSGLRNKLLKRVFL